MTEEQYKLGAIAAIAKPTLKIIFSITGIITLFFVILFFGIVTRTDPLGAIYYLSTGWVSFPLRTLPNVFWNLEILTSALVSWILLIFLSQWLFTWIFINMGAADDSPGQKERHWPIRWTLSCVMLLFLTFTAGIVFTGAVHQVAWIASGNQRLFTEGYNPCSVLQSDLANLSIAQEEYFVEYDAYAINESGLSGFSISEGSNISVEVGQDSFVAKGWNGRCLDFNNKPIIITWDSANGGFQDD
ncbi:MAG: hypothetical protein OEZ28_11530 [Nitrospinota bacterium]|nr:hypothetical protein [Nitrospinota bacterium]